MTASSRLLTVPRVPFTALADHDVRGIAVHIASRIADLGAANDIIVSRTVKDLVAGSGLVFEDFGTHCLKGIPEAWQLFRVAA